MAAAYAQSAAGQTTYLVDDNAAADPAPGDASVSDPLEDGTAQHPFDAIQEAIDASDDGDTVEVLDGEYRGEGNRELDYDGRLITVRSRNGPENCTILCDGEARGFIFHSGESAQAVVSGLTIRSGLARLSSSYGGGAEDRPPDDFGGCIYSIDTSVVIEDCVITDCTAERVGGGVYFEGGTPVLRNCTIRENEAHDAGAGIRTVDCSPTIENCSITDNKTTGIPAVRGDGAGISCDGGAPLISQCNISDNSAKFGRAAGVFLGGGGRLVECVVHSNSCADNSEGGIGSRGDVTLDRCIITENQAIDGAGVFHGGGTLTVVNCIIARNRGVNHYDDASGAAIEFLDPVVVINSTIMDNQTASNAAPGGISQFEGAGEHLTIVNSILWDLDSVTIPPGASIEYSCVMGNWEGTGNIDSDPKFVDAVGGDYHLAVGSPCVNSGTNDVDGLPESDIDGHDRIQAGRVDMGSFETAYASPGVPCDEGCPFNLGEWLASLCGQGMAQSVVASVILACGGRLAVTRRRRHRKGSA